MRLEQLKYFLEISKTNSIRAAAENLFISAPALGTTIQNLEKELGFPLFERQRSGVILTSYGQQALIITTQILELSNQFHWIQTEYQQKIQENLTGDFVISIVIAANSNFMYDIIPLFSKMHPQVNLTIIEQSSNFVLNNVLSSKSDLGILFADENTFEKNNIESYFSDFIYQLLYKENMYVLVGPNSPLASRKYITLKEVASYPLALTGSNLEDTSVYDHLFSEFPDAQIIVRSNSVNLLQQYILKNNAIGLSFSSSVQKYSSQAIAIPVQDTLPFSIYALYNQKSNKISIINAFLKIIREFHCF